MNGAKKVYIKSFGCQMNVYDSQRMADTLAPQGYVETATATDADLVTSTPATSVKRPSRKSTPSSAGCAA